MTGNLFRITFPKQVMYDLKFLLKLLKKKEVEYIEHRSQLIKRFSLEGNPG